MDYQGQPIMITPPGCADKVRKMTSARQNVNQNGFLAHSCMGSTMWRGVQIMSI